MCCFLISTVAFSAGDDKYEVGGPLAGVKLPLYPTYFGEPAGKPGNSRGAPQFQLYPGSVENWRAYMFKYLPIRSIFDKQSQVKNWVAPNIPGCSSKTIVKYAQPVYKAARGAGAEFTGNHEPAVPTIELKPGDTIIETSLGTLSEGMYCIRVIAAVRQKDNSNYRKDLFGVFTVNDKIDGGNSVYKKRVPYVDQFYSIMEFYFHALKKKEYKIKLSVDPKSKINILVHNVSFDDVLVGFVKKSIKKRANNPLPAAVKKKYLAWIAEIKNNPEKLAELQKLDDITWNGFPRINYQYNLMLKPAASAQSFVGLNKKARYGFDGKTYKEIWEQYGRWQEERSTQKQNILIYNKKLGLEYSMEDLAAYKPLPKSFPFKDCGLGISKPDANGKTGEFYTPIAEMLSDRVRRYQHAFTGASKMTIKASDKPDALRNIHLGILKLIRFSYDYPALDDTQDLGSIISLSGPYGRQSCTRQRATAPWFLSWYTEYGNHLLAYDRLYELIKADTLLVDSVRKHIPWVKNSDDIIKLLDMYLVQNTARKIMRYHYFTFAQCILMAATVLGDKDVCSPWMEFAFTKSYRYGFVPQGLDTLTDNLADRSGFAWKASSFYSIGEGECIAADALEEYCDVSGDDKFRMFNKYHPKAITSTYTPLHFVYAGYEFPRIGDVTGPDKVLGASLNNSKKNFKLGWKYTKDPVFAALIYYFIGIDSYTTEQQAEIKKAAESFKRMPYLTQSSRFIPNWCGILETGKRHDDFRFRRGAMVRTGYGVGHNHNDSLDLQIVSHGILMTVDAGQRPGYTRPGSSLSRLHNTVTVNDKNRKLTGGWIGNIVDSANFAYLYAHAGGAGNKIQGSRQVMLIDVNDDGPTQTLPIKKQIPNVKLPKITSSPDGYVFDVFRENTNGKLKYNFHAMVNDDFKWNALNEQKSKIASEGKVNNEQIANFTATSPETLHATWRMRRVPESPLQKTGSEKACMGKNFDPDSPRKHLSLHLLGVKGARLMRENLITKKEGIQNSFTYIGVEIDDKNGRVFAAVIEPYVGKPFIKSAKLIEIPDNEDDSLAAVAANIASINGRKDWAFADGRPEKQRKFGKITVSGEAAMVAVDKKGIKYAMLTGGTELNDPNIKIKTSRREYTAKIISTDYYNKLFVLDKKWPDFSRTQIVEIGKSPRMTAYTAIKFKASKSGNTQIETQNSPMLFVIPVKEVIPEKNAVNCTFNPKTSVSPVREWFVSNSDASKSWLTSKLENMTFTLSGKVTSEDFPKKKLIMWESGAGDTVRLATQVSLQRIAENKFLINSNVKTIIKLKGSIQYSFDNKHWIKAETASNGWCVIKIDNDNL